jgi:hypothetical protein
MIMSVEHPGEMLALLNVRDRKLMDVWRIDLRTGATMLEVENPGDVAWWFADDHLVVGAGCGYTPQGGFELRVRSAAGSPWRTLVKTSPDEEALPLGFSKDGRELFPKSSVGSDTMRVIAVDLASGGERKIARMDRFDAEDVMIHPARHVIEAVAFAPGRVRWQVVDPAIQADFDAIAKLEDGDFRVASRDLADHIWVVAFTTPHRPVRYLRWDREKKESTFLFSHRPGLVPFELAELRSIKYRARDGLEVHGYLTLPPGIAPRNLPSCCIHMADRGFATIGFSTSGRNYLRIAAMRCFSPTIAARSATARTTFTPAIASRPSRCRRT